MKSGVATGEDGTCGTPGDAARLAPDRDRGAATQPDTPSPARNRKHRKRWPIWSVSQSETMCSICGWTGVHSTVCPFGPEPTKSRARR